LFDLEIAAIDPELLAFLAESAFVLLVETFHVLGKEKGAAFAIHSPHGGRFGEGVEMHDVAIVAREFPIGEDDIGASFALDPLMGVAGAVRFRDVLIAGNAKELVFTRFGNLPEGQDPRLASLRRARLA